MARCDEVGAAAYLVKPIDHSELFDTLLALLFATDETAAAVRDPTKATLAARLPRHGAQESCWRKTAPSIRSWRSASWESAGTS